MLLIILGAAIFELSGYNNAKMACLEILVNGNVPIYSGWRMTTNIHLYLDYHQSGQIADNIFRGCQIKKNQALMIVKFSSFHGKNFQLYMDVQLFDIVS